MGQFDLEPPFRRCGALAENLEDQAGPVDHLRAHLLLQILLLDWTEDGIDDQQPRLFVLCRLGNFLDLALAEERRSPDGADPKRSRSHDIDPDCFRKPFGFIDARLGRATRSIPRQLGHRNDRALASGDVRLAVAVVIVQEPAPSSATSA
jgi:hypothetical protein